MEKARSLGKKMYIYTSRGQPPKYPSFPNSPGPSPYLKRLVVSKSGTDFLKKKIIFQLWPFY